MKAPSILIFIMHESRIKTTLRFRISVPIVCTRAQCLSNLVHDNAYMLSIERSKEKPGLLQQSVD